MSPPCRLLLAAAPLLLASCFQHSVVIKVAPDGSGIVHRRTYTNPLAMEEHFAGDDNMIAATDAELRTITHGMGDGIAIRESATGKNPAGWLGQEVVWTFNDINELSLGLFDTFPSEGAPPEFAGLRYTFEMTEPGQLQVHTPDISFVFTELADNLDDLNDPEVQAMAKQSMEGTRLGIYLQVEGEVTDTNAQHQAGSLIPLIDFQFGAIAADTRKIRKVAALGAPHFRDDRASLAEALESIEEVTANVQESVTVDFE